MIEQKEKGCVYFFKHIGLDPIKIGYSSNSSPVNRFQQFKTYAPFGAELIGFIKSGDAKKLETHLHKIHESKRLEGEWFNISKNEANSLILLHSNIEDVRDKNDFQIAWAKESFLDETTDIDLFALEIENLPTSEKVYKICNKFKDSTIKDLAAALKISRQTFYNHLKN